MPLAAANRFQWTATNLSDEMKWTRSRWFGLRRALYFFPLRNSDQCLYWTIHDTQRRWLHQRWNFEYERPCAPSGGGATKLRINVPNFWLRIKFYCLSLTYPCWVLYIHEKYQWCCQLFVWRDNLHQTNSVRRRLAFAKDKNDCKYPL